VYCGQTAAWIKMPLGMDVGFGQGYVTLDGTYSSPKQGDTAAPPVLADVYCGHANGWTEV